MILFCIAVKLIFNFNHNSSNVKNKLKLVHLKNYKNTRTRNSNQYLKIKKNP